MSADSIHEFKLKSERALTTILTLPATGAHIRVKRASRKAYLQNGQIPQSLFQASLTGEAGDVKGKTMTPEELAQFTKFQEDIIIESVTSFKVVRGEASENEVSLDEFPDADKDFIFNWAMSGSSGIGVRTKDGDISAEDLKSIRRKRRLSRRRNGSAEVRPETVEIVGAEG